MNALSDICTMDGVVVRIGLVVILEMDKVAHNSPWVQRKLPNQVSFLHRFTIY